MCNAWSDGRRIEIHPVETTTGLITVGQLALEPVQAMHLAIDLYHAAYSADARQRELGFSLPRLPLFESSEVPRD